MHKFLNQKGVAHILLLLVLGLGIIAGVYLVQHPQIFKPKAFEQPPVHQSSSDVPQLQPPTTEVEQVKISGIVFGDNNGNGIQDSNEVGIPNIVIFRPSIKGEYYLGQATTDQEGKWSMVIDNAGKYDFSDCSNCPQVLISNLPYGWEVIGDKEKLLQLTSSGRIASTENINFGIRGNLSVSGIVFFDGNKNGIRDSNENLATQNIVSIVVDGSGANNVSKNEKGINAAYDFSRADGSFYINNLPPYSNFKVKAFAACPLIVTTPPFNSEIALGPQNQTNYNFGVAFDEGCISQ